MLMIWMDLRATWHYRNQKRKIISLCQRTCPPHIRCQHELYYTSNPKATRFSSAAFVSRRVVSGEPLARPPVISLCCGVARRVVDKFGTGVAQSQAGGLVEAIVVRLGHGVSGKFDNTVLSPHPTCGQNKVHTIS